MKKIKLLFLFLLIITLPSCNSLDTKTVYPQEKNINYKLEGKSDTWEIKDANYSISDDFKVDGGTLSYISKDKINEDLEFISIEILKINKNVEDTLLSTSVVNLTSFEKEIKLGTISRETYTEDILENDDKLYCVIKYKTAKNKIKEEKIQLNIILE